MAAHSNLQRELRALPQARTAQRPSDAAAVSRQSSKAGSPTWAQVGGKALTRHRRPAWRSPLTRRILLLNVLVLVIPVIGLLHLDQYRQSLVDSEIEAMTTQATTIALAMGSAAVRDTDGGEQTLMHETVRQLLRVILSGAGIRARVFSRGGDLVGDSYLLSGPDGKVEVEELAPPEIERGVTTLVDEIYDTIVHGLPGFGALPAYREAVEQRASDYDEVVAALAGEAGSRLRFDSRDQLLLSVAVPIQRYRQVMAALMVTKEGTTIEQAVRDRRRDILLVFGVALAVTVLLSFYLARTIALPIRRLADAADRVRGGNGKRERIPDLSERRDEIGDLSASLIEMTEALRDRLDAIEGFAADVAHEIKNPLTSLRSAVETAARVEDSERQKKLMSIIVDDVQRLDRLISDISDASRLDAELARAESELVDVAGLLHMLVEVHRASIDGGGPRFRLDIREDQRLAVLALEGRLGQVFRNLIANAVSFSPSRGTIELAAWREPRLGPAAGDWIVITVADEGPGIPHGKLEAIFDRFYSERPEGEKFGTHSGLGLSISKQIVEALGGSIRAENRPGGGARFVVRLPAS